MTKVCLSKILRTAVSAAVLVFAGAVRPASADNIAVGDIVTFAGNLNSLGGDLVGGPSFSGAVFGLDVGDNNSIDILSFCLQRTQFVDFENVFHVGGIGNIVDDEPTPPGEALAEQTAWIYDAFRTGALTALSVDAVNSIQYAIWFFQSEDLTDLAGSIPAGAQAIIDAANAAIGGGWTNGGRVQVVNLFYDAQFTSKAQDQLTWTAVPEPGSMVLLGAGLLAVARASRRRRATQSAA